MKLKLKSKNAPPKTTPEESSSTQSSDYPNRFKSFLYLPEDGEDTFTTDLVAETTNRCHLKAVSRTIAPCREGVCKGGLSFTVPFLGQAREDKLRKDFAPVFKAIKVIEKTYGVSFAGIVHGDDSPFTPKEPTQKKEEAEKPRKLKKLKLGKP